MKYNSEEYIDLLKYQQKLKKENKSFKTQDPVKYLKLKNYSARFTEDLHWFQRNEYLKLIEDFLNSKIDGKEFDSKFSEMVRFIEKKSNLLSKNYEALKRIELSSRSLGFGTWISEIYLCCNEFYPDFNEESDRTDIPFGKNEDQLRNAINSLFPEIQKYFKI